ncbi:MAG: hypothetical protein DRP99_03500 [Candidatus Latescibacterota bacterium]|nr:MAG: hypothetical protein DRP99_03500 [Candidatus Latescibacterota bacterium]
MRATTEALKRLDIAKRVAQAYAKLDGVDSLAVGGSTARGNADRFSDVEIWMTYSSLPDEEARKQILNKLDESGHPVLMKDLEGGAKLAETFRVSGVQVSILPGTNDDLLSVGIDIEKHLGEPSEKGLADFHDCVVLYDPKGLYETVKRRRENYPVDLGIKLIKRKLYEVVKICAVDIPRALRNGNWLWILDSRSTAQEALLRVVFALNRDYFPRVKDAEWLILSMTHVPKGFLKGISEYAREPDIRKARKMLINLTKDLISLVEQIWPQAIDGDTVTWLDRLSEDVIPVLD